MGVREYMTKNGKRFKADFWLRFPDGSSRRKIKKNIPTREMAKKYMEKALVAAFEGKYFDMDRGLSFTVKDAWKLYQSKGKRDNRSWQTDEGRAKHLLEHFGDHKAEMLTEADVDEYRDIRLTETTRRGGPPSPATMDREVELLKRILNYAKRSKRLKVNPIADVSLLRVPNTRDVVISEIEFERLLNKADPELRPIILVAYDTGMRLNEVLGLKRSRIDFKSGKLTLRPHEVKEGKQSRIVYLTDRTLAELEKLTPSISGYVFVNPKTGTRWKDIRRMWKRALRAAELPEDVWFHDQRRSFATNARKRGVSETTVMQMTGHRTRSAFERYNIRDERDLREAIQRIEHGRAEELAEAEREQELEDSKRASSDQ